MKKIAILVMTLALALSLCACACTNNAPATDPSNTGNSTTNTTMLPTDTMNIPMPETNIPDPSVDTSMTGGAENGGNATTGEDNNHGNQSRLMQ